MISSQAPQFENPGCAPLLEKKLSALPPYGSWLIGIDSLLQCVIKSVINDLADTFIGQFAKYHQHINSIMFCCCKTANIHL